MGQGTAARTLASGPGPGWQDRHHHVRRFAASPGISALTLTGPRQRRQP
ncbi:hypothetical protein L6241_10700 [Janibacter sp. Y6]|nr:hypothetical protein [Janibacter melonis]